jgi:hypothetical protein
MLERPSIWSGHRVRQSPRKRKSQKNRYGERLAVLRAYTGARLLNDDRAYSLADAAERVGSSASYVRAALTILKSEDWDLYIDTLWGREPLLASAAKVRRRADLLTAYRKASRQDHGAAGSTIGVDAVFDEMIAPNI